ncbi:MAG: IS5 family transposase [Rubrivivax sp.]|nr:IS5 family transposase [Rubrivivax sp.]
MATDDFFRARLDTMIDLRHPLVVLAGRLPWPAIEAALSMKFAHQDLPAKSEALDGLFGVETVEFGGGISRAGRPRLPIRLMAGLLYLKNSFNLSDEELVQRWSENVYFQYFCGLAYFEPRLPCDATQIGRFRRAIGEEGLELLLKATIDTAVQTKVIKPQELERVIVDSTVQEKAIAHPTDSRLLEIARHKVVGAAKRMGLQLKQTFVHEGKELRHRAGRYAHAKQFKRLKKVLKRQRTILGIVMREVRRKLDLRLQPAHDVEAPDALTLMALNTVLQRAERIRVQRPKDKNKLYAMHAPEAECISKGKAHRPYEFGVKVGLAVTHKSGLMVGARSFTGNPYDGHTLAEQLEQVRNLCQDTGVQPKTVVVDLGYRGVDAQNPGVQIIHRGKFKSLTTLQRRWLKRRQAIEPAIGHTKADHRMDRCWLQGQTGDALHALSCALGYNIRWLMRAMQAKVRQALSWLLQMVDVGAKQAAIGLVERTGRLLGSVMRWVGGLGMARPPRLPLLAGV